MLEAAGSTQHRVHQPTVCIHSVVHLHPEAPRLALPVCFISGLRLPATFFVELGAEMSVASTTMPLLRVRLLVATDAHE